MGVADNGRAQKADRRRQVAVLSVSIDLGYQVLHGHLISMSDVLEAGPERLFDADTSVMTVDHDRALSNWQLM